MASLAIVAKDIYCKRLWPPKIVLVVLLNRMNKLQQLALAMSELLKRTPWFGHTSRSVLEL